MGAEWAGDPEMPAGADQESTKKRLLSGQEPRKRQTTWQKTFRQPWPSLGHRNHHRNTVASSPLPNKAKVQHLDPLPQLAFVWQPHPSTGVMSEGCHHSQWYWKCHWRLRGHNGKMPALVLPRAIEAEALRKAESPTPGCQWRPRGDTNLAVMRCSPMSSDGCTKQPLKRFKYLASHNTQNVQFSIKNHLSYTKTNTKFKKTINRC